MSRPRHLDLVVEAFVDDPFYRWLAPGEGHRRRVLRAVMRRALASCEVIGDDEGCLAFTTPTTKRGGGWSLGLALLLRHPIRAWRGLGLLRALARARPRGPHVHVEVIAVAASARGKGVARRLFAALPDPALIHLETTNPANLAFYAHLGLTEVAQITRRGVPTAWVLRRPQGASVMQSADGVAASHSVSDTRRTD